MLPPNESQFFKPLQLSEWNGCGGSLQAEGAAPTLHGYMHAWCYWDLGNGTQSFWPRIPIPIIRALLASCKGGTTCVGKLGSKTRWATSLCLCWQGAELQPFTVTSCPHDRSWSRLSEWLK